MVEQVLMVYQCLLMVVAVVELELVDLMEFLNKVALVEPAQPQVLMEHQQQELVVAVVEPMVETEPFKLVVPQLMVEQVDLVVVALEIQMQVMQLQQVQREQPTLEVVVAVAALQQEKMVELAVQV
tara:strand:+ start:592 stop:969 length:378 start_codon:yes stop_codon:yes gene_type:complete